MMTPNRFFRIIKGKEIILSRAEAFHTTEKLKELGISLSSTTLYKLTKETNLKRVSNLGDSITIETY